MTRLYLAWTLASLALAACQNMTSASSTVAVDGKVLQVASGGGLPADLVQSAGAALGSDDQVTNNGNVVDADQPLPNGTVVHLQVVRSIPVLVNGSPVLTTARSVGEVIREQGFELHASDVLDPPADTYITSGLLIAFSPSTALQVSADATDVLIRARARSNGVALADTGIPIQGLDSVEPSESSVLAEGGEARLTRITESLVLEQAPIPFESRATDSADLEAGIEQVLQPGIPGLAVVSTRVRRHDGLEVSRLVAPASVILTPQDRVIAQGTRLVERTETIDGVSITYWRKMQMYATVYSPCNSGTSDGACSTGTASGRSAGKGVVAVDPGLYAYLNGQRLFIPGYGFAVIGDVGGGYIVEQNLGISRYKWIDLGFDDNNIEDMTGWISVYFLAPAPATIPDVLR